MNYILATLLALSITIQAIFSFYLEHFCDFIKSLGSPKERWVDIQTAYQAAYTYYLNKKGEDK